MSYETLLVEQIEAVQVVTLNRPKRLNALSAEVITELQAVLEESAFDNDIKVLIITGAPRPDGRPCFCAGLDLKEIAEKGPPTLKRRGIVGAVESLSLVDVVENESQQLFNSLEGFPKPAIAAIDGVCTAGGLELALGCDLRIVADTAQISDMHIKNLGAIGGGGATVRLPRLIGPAKAKELMFTGEPIDGEEAWRIGFANQVVPSNKLQDEAKALGNRIAALDGDALRLAKASINASFDMNATEALRYSYLCAAALGKVDVAAQQFMQDRR